MSISNKYDLIIFGSGMTGLSSAYYYKKKYPKARVLIIEKENEVGGLASNISFGKIKLEKFYHHWYERDKDIFSLIKEIKKSNKIKKNPVLTGMFYANTQFRFSSILDIINFKPLAVFNRVRLLIFLSYCRINTKWRHLDQLFAHKWLKKWCGDQIYKVIWRPLLIGKFGAHYKKISAAWIWKRIKDRAENKKNISSKDEYFFYEGGFGTLANDIKKYLKQECKVDFLLKTEAKKILKNKDKNYQIILGKNIKNKIFTKKILFTMSNYEIYKITINIFPKFFLKKLLKIKYLGNICLILFLNKSLSKEYWTNVNDASFPFIAVIEHTNLVNKKTFSGSHVVYLSKYLDTKSKLFKMSKEKYLKFSFFYLKKIFPNLEFKSLQKSYLYKAKYAQPLTFKNYLKKRIPFVTPISNIYISNMSQIYPRDRSTNHAVEEGKKIVNYLN